VLAVSGKDFAIVAGDTRMSDGGYGISSRDQPKLFKLTDHCTIATSGMQAEAVTLRKVLASKCTQYAFKTGKSISATAVAQMLSNTLYYKRFFPYYTFNILAGVDEKGAGAVWGYDAVGSHERLDYVCTGTGQALITSLLDNQVAFKNQEKNKPKDGLSLEQTLAIVEDAFVVAGERDIYTGDYVDIWIITKDGTKSKRKNLRLD